MKLATFKRWIFLVFCVAAMTCELAAQITEADSMGTGLSVGSGNPLHHRVKLSWNPSVPASRSARDAIIGYIVYRSTKPHDATAKPINSTRITTPSYEDTQVEAGKVYYYVTRSVASSGTLSPPSNEVRVEVPH